VGDDGGSGEGGREGRGCRWLWHIVSSCARCVRPRPCRFFCCPPRAPLYDGEDHGQVLLVGHLDPAILVRVVAPEHVRQPLRTERTRTKVKVRSKVKVFYCHVMSCSSEHWAILNSDTRVTWQATVCKKVGKKDKIARRINIYIYIYIERHNIAYIR